MMKFEVSKAMRPPLLFGWKIDDPNNNDLMSIIKLIENLGIAFAVLDLNRLTSGQNRNNHIVPEYNLESGISSSLECSKLLKNFLPLGRSDLALPNEVWSQRVVSFIKTNSFESLKTQLDWSCYVAVRSIIVDLEAILTTNEAEVSSETGECLDVLDRLVHFCQVLSSYLKQPNFPTIWLSLDCCNQSWNTWYMAYELCNFSEKLKVCLKLQPLETEIDMWQSEPVKCVILSEDSAVLVNGRVTLSKEIANYLSFLMKNSIKVVFGWNLNYKNLISDPFNYSAGSVPDSTMEDGFVFGVKELMKVVKKVYSKLGPYTVNELYGKGYEDLLQVPIQPLRDNLDSTTYNEFEKCSFKYNSYSIAINSYIQQTLEANRKNKQPRKLNHGGNDAEDMNGSMECDVHTNLVKVNNYVVYVVGAGRGPLVEVALDVFKKNGIPNYTIYAVDKNPYTMITLQDKMWINNWRNVKLLCTDMRDINEVIKGSRGRKGEGSMEDNILVVSELLGPFGDNELSPECLYGFESNFKPSEKVQFIPKSYTSYVMPLHAPQIWAKIKNLGNSKNFHMPYTVHLKSYYCVSDEFMDCFRFDHPAAVVKSEDKKHPPSHALPNGRAEDAEVNLERYKVIKFRAINDCYVHGFGGYFKCTLFDGINLSILPKETENLKSWFPMFFPIEMPFPVKKSQTITFHIWRKTDHLRVWYEWAFTTPATTSIHNVNGFSYSISKK